MQKVFCFVYGNDYERMLEPFILELDNKYLYTRKVPFVSWSINTIYAQFCDRLGMPCATKPVEERLDTNAKCIALFQHLLVTAKIDHEAQSQWELHIGSWEVLKSKSSSSSSSSAVESTSTSKKRVKRSKTQGTFQGRHVTIVKSEDRPSKSPRISKSRLCLLHIMTEYGISGAKPCPHGDNCHYWHADSTTDSVRIKKELSELKDSSTFRMIVGSKGTELLTRAGLA
jgi:hypothetical protein